ncbi:ATPase [Pseudomonas sp. Env-44]|uniref:ATPase n=1 Tax=unclassified Pseudomonas TaxID=196821 RepID=UPI003521E192
MPAKIQVSEAYCLELGEVVSITDARRAYFSQPEPRARFTFQCSYADCMALSKRPTITAVNYASLPQDTYRAAHFRDPGVGHAPGCHWQDEEPAVSDQDPGGEAAHKDREAKRKLHDFIDEFDPTAVKPKDGDGVSGNAGSKSADGRGKGSSGVAKGSSFSTRNRTSSFERLVEYYRNAHKDLPSTEFFGLQLKVTGEGEMPLISYFPSISKAAPDSPSRVIHGGARLEPRKGSGFMFWFIDRVDGKGVYLKVTKQEMDAYRFRGFFNDILAEDDADYFRVFGLGRLLLSETKKSYRLEIEDLNRLTIFAVKKKQFA